MGKLCGKRVLITGSNRGLGLEMVKQLLNKFNPETIFATCRSPQYATELNALAQQDKRIYVMKIDISEPNDFPKAVQVVEKATNGKGIHVLINNAGIFSSQSQSLESVQMEMMLKYLHSFLPLLIKSTAADKLSGLVVNFSSKLGSIADNKSGGYYASRCCRSAMNAATKSMGIDLKDKEIIAVGINPGWVRTDQGGSSAPLLPEDSVSGILKVLDEVQESQSGLLLQYDGKILEW